MRILLIESEPEDVLFLRDVLMEIGEGRYGANWVNIEVLEAVSWSKAAAILASERIDMILLDLDIADSHGMETFRRAQLAAQAVPMILLMGAYEESLGIQLVRAGAQDFLLKKQVDCAPLAHAMRNAIERHRLLTAARAGSTHDTLTGLLNRAGFLSAADRDRKLAERLGRRLLLMVSEAPSAATQDPQRRDLVLVEAADRLRTVTGSADLVARIEPTRFGMTVFDTDREPVEAARTRLHAVLQQHHSQSGAAIFCPDHPVTLDALLEQALQELSPNAFAMGT